MVRNAAFAARPDDIRQHNLSLALTHIHRDGPLSRAELTRRLGLSRSTVHALVGDLTRLGLVVEEVPTGRLGVGRPSHVVAPRPGGPYAVGVDIDAAEVTVASIGIGGAIRAREHLEIDGAVAPDLLVAEIRDAVDRLCAGDRSGSRFCGVGVSVPGTVDLDTGRVGVAPNLGWESVPLGGMLTQAFPDVATVIGNDGNFGVLAEHRRGNGRGCDDVVYMLGRVGVGAGIIMNGVPLRGHDGHAGEIGHNVLDPSGPLCHCGQTGCVETYLGDMALLARAGRTVEAPLDQEMASFFADARRGDADALGSVQAAAEPLGRTIASLFNTLNVERVVLGGTVGELLSLARDEIEGYVARYTLGTARRQVQLVLPAFGNDSPLLGAAEIAFEGLLADPHLAAKVRPSATLCR